MLARVEHEQARPVSDPHRQRLERIGLGRHADGAGDLVGDHASVVDLGQLDEPHRPARRFGMGHGEGEAGLAGSARPGQRHDAVVGERFVDPLELLLPADQPGRRGGQP